MDKSLRATGTYTECMVLENPKVVRIIYGTLGVLMLVFIDVYLLFGRYPWVASTDAAFLGMCDQLSPLSDMIEGFIQSSFQIYMYVHMVQLGRHAQGSMNSLLLLSFLPCLVVEGVEAPYSA